MNYAILCTTGQYKAVSGLHLVCSRCFTPKSVFYTESVMLGFKRTAIDHFHFRNNTMKDILVNQSNRLGVELFYHVHVNTFVVFWLNILGKEILDQQS